MLESIMKGIIKRNLASYLEDRLKELDPGKIYMLVVPNDVPEEDIHKLSAVVKNDVKLYIVQADNVRLMEFS